MRKLTNKLHVGAAIVSLALASSPVFASSHMDAPLIVLDPPANTTDVYAFVDQDDTNSPKHLVVALGVYPFEEPGIGPNKYNFDDNVLYQIHVALGSDVAAGRATVSYQFRFNTTFKNTATILQSYLGVIQHVGDANQNLVQTYTVTKVDHRIKGKQGITVLGTGIVPPNNEGIATPYYNQGDDGNNPAKEGVTNSASLDRYTAEAVTNLSGGYVAFAGQRDDGFYSDVLSIFDILNLRNPGKDAQGGFNIHLMALEIPVSELGGDQQVVGVYATTSRQSIRILSNNPTKKEDKLAGNWVQVARQGNPLFNEGLVALADKDLYSRTSPSDDATLFKKYALTPELAGLINAILLGGTDPVITTGRTDIAGIFIPDLIKVDLSTPAARLTTTGGNDESTGFSRLGVFGGDVLKSNIQDPFGNGGFIPGGWPNGRRFGDDPVDITIDALLSDLKVTPPVVNTFPPGDGVISNDVTYSSVFPYESTPHNGRNHTHP
ncbi:MAG TPA: DUF4331 domain-containing protein [Verrucomicrobiae bacterium]|nr:DUF4331 domain-containing protein [Verrucomicrobiae bacterium]